jgi:ABC-type sugar transport system ATPase subunit
MSEVILEFRNINKSFFGVQVLENVSFQLKQGCVLGLIGENGAGKTTMMNIMGGVIPFDSGELLLQGSHYDPKNPGDATKAGIGFIHQELNLFTNLSIAENLFIEEFPRVKGVPFIDKKVIRERTKEYLKMVDLEFSPDVLVERLSPGERQLVEIAKALSTDAQIIIFDEPTTSLTNRETERLFKIIDRLKKDGRSIIYISHILGDVKRLANEILVLRDGTVVGGGDANDFDVNRMISMMVGRDITQLYPPRKTTPSETPILCVSGVSQSGIVDNINFKLHKNEILGMFGLMGSGRSELARIIFGLDPFESGEIQINGKTIDRISPKGSIANEIAFVTENRREEGLLMNLTVADNIGLVALPTFSNNRFKMVDNGRMRNAIDEVAESLKIKAANVHKSLAKGLSGGNQQKAVIGKWLLSKPTVLIVDEPTRGIDVGAKYEVYNIINDLSSNGACILFISSELEELMGVCDRILVMSYGEITGEFCREEFNRENILRAAFRENGNGKK